MNHYKTWLFVLKSLTLWLFCTVDKILHWYNEYYHRGLFRLLLMFQSKL